MIKFYFLTILFSCTLVGAQQSAIKRSSLSTSVIDAQHIQFGRYKIQQSIGHMGISSTISHKDQTVTRGFLLPQYGASKENPIPEFNWVVYPNPFESYINIDFDIPVFGNLTIYLHDVTGQLIIEKKVIARQQQRIYLGHLAQAEYLLTAELMGKTFSQALLNYKKINEDN